MRTIRTALAILVIAFLCFGYGASQWAALHGPQAAAEYAQKVDVPSMRMLSLALLALMLLFAFIPDREQEESKDS